MSIPAAQQRNHLRRAISAHPAWSRAYREAHGLKSIEAQSMDELKSTAANLGLDVFAAMSGALAGQEQQHVQAAADVARERSAEAERFEAIRQARKLEVACHVDDVADLLSAEYGDARAAAPSTSATKSPTL